MKVETLIITCGKDGYTIMNQKGEIIKRPSRIRVWYYILNRRAEEDVFFDITVKGIEKERKKLIKFLREQGVYKIKEEV